MTLDPRVCLIIAVIGAFCLSFLHTHLAAVFALFLTASLLFAARPPLLFIRDRFFAVNFFVFFLWFTVPFFVSGEVIGKIAFLSISREGIDLCLLISLKTNAILFLFLALVARMSPPIIGYALDRLHVPEKVVFLFLFACRYIPVLTEEWTTLQTSARLRCFVPKTSRHTYNTIANMLGMVLVRSLERSTRIYEAMLLRCFTGHFQSVTTFQASFRDVIFVLLSVLCMLFLLLVDFGILQKWVLA